MSRLRRFSPLALWFSACEVDTTVDDLTDPIIEEPPAIAADPMVMDFGDRLYGTLGIQPVTVTNTGGGVLRIDGLDVRGSDAVFYQWIAPFPFTLGPDQSFTFDVRFQASTDGLHEADVVIRSNASNAPELALSVQGRASGPRLVITPSAWEVGPLPMPCASATSLFVANEGTQPAVIDEVRLDGDPSFQLARPLDLPLTLDPGASVEVALDHAPLVDGVATASLVVVAAAPAASPDPASLVAAHAWDGWFEEVVDAPPAVMADLILAVDQSQSMDDQQDRLAAEVPAFAARLRDLAVDWRLGVVTEQDGCFNGVFDATTVDLEAAVSAAVREGDAASNPLTEALLELVFRATDRDAPGLCNEGFHRAGAAVHAVYVSDEDDQSPRSWSEYLDDLRVYAGGRALAQGHAIVDLADVCGEGDQGDGYVDLAVASDGLRLDICADDWGPLVDALATALAAPVLTVPLGHPTVDPSSVTVTVDGAPWTTGWRLDPSPWTVVFDATVPPSARVVVRYRGAGACP